MLIRFSFYYTNLQLRYCMDRYLNKYAFKFLVQIQISNRVDF